MKKPTPPTLNLSSGSASIPLPTLDEMRRYIREAQEAFAQAPDEDAVPPQPVTDEAAAAEWKAVVEVVSFAVGNLHPSTVAGWPWQALKAIAEAAQRRGDGTAAMIWFKFAAKAQAYDVYRVAQREARERGEPDPPMPPI